MGERGPGGQVEGAESPDFRAYDAQVVNSRKPPDCVAGAGGIEPCSNPLLHKDFSIPARPFDSIFDSKAKALVGMTDDEVAYIEAKGGKASVVPELSIIHHFANFCGSNAGALRSAMPDADSCRICTYVRCSGVMRTRFAQPELLRV